MSRAQVRAAVANWIATDPSLPYGLNQVFTSFPKRINFEQNSVAGQMTRAAAVVFIANESEQRVAVGGAYNGWKRVDYRVTVQVFVHSVENYAQDAMDSYDQIIDGIKNRLRGGGHRLGMESGDVIWQAFEEGIDALHGEPKTNDGGATEQWCEISGTVTQMIQA
jgi:hypothetical protein